ncbi:glycosyltransferase [Flavobacterium sp. XS1P32]|uniref:glycosyltransferase n=1 Tax=unclassified Flavobacterium TaxID=196869 RepID=UPI003AAF8DA3
MKNIVHIVDTLCIGGRENVVIDICNNLDIEKYNVFVITLTNDENDAKIKLNSNIIFFSLPIKHNDLVGFNTFLNFRKAVFSLRKLLVSIDPDIIHTHSYLHRLLIAGIAMKSISNNFKYFHTVHTSGMYYDSNRLLDKIKLSIDGFALGLNRPTLIGISEIVQENNIKYFKSQTKTSIYIPNGIDLDIFNTERIKVHSSLFGVLDENIVITYVARLCKGKNHFTLLKAITLLKKKHPSVKLFLAGDGDMRAEIEKIIIEDGLQDNIQLLGSISNVEELLMVTKIAVFPSEFEGFTLTLIEKMAMGLPVVAADNQIFKKLICNGENGLLFSMFDEVELAKCISNLIEDDKLYNKISKNALLFSKIFSIQKMVSEHEIYYEK